MTRAPDPTPEQCASLKERFYSAQPWIYFQQRLAHLMFVASDHDRYRSMLREGCRAGAVSLRIESRDARDAATPTPEQSFVAIETEILLHHSAETLLRFAHAHSEPAPCPWVRMAGVTTAKAFKDWVQAVLDGSRDELAELCRRIFALDPSSAADLDAYIRYLRLYARHFLASDSYNAAKHGMALYGGNERVNVEVEGWRLFERDGTSLDWLAIWPRSDTKRPPRWTQVSRLFDADAANALIATATNLMRSIWIRGREQQLGEPWNEVYRPTPPDQLFGALGIRDHILVTIYRPCPAPGEQETITVETAHFELPEDDDQDGRPEDPGPSPPRR